MFAHSSDLPRKLEEAEFVPYLGYAVRTKSSCGVYEAMADVIGSVTMCESSDFMSVITGFKNSDEDKVSSVRYLNLGRKRRRTPNSEEESSTNSTEANGKIIIKHGAHNFTEGQYADLNWFVMASEIMFGEDTYAAAFSVVKKFRRLSFQSLTQSVVLSHMISMSSLGTVPWPVMQHLREQTGEPWLSATGFHSLWDKFKKPLHAYIIPRRHGKTSFLHYDMAAFLALSNTDASVMYCAHTATLALMAFNRVGSIVDDMIDRMTGVMRINHRENGGEKYNAIRTYVPAERSIVVTHTKNGRTYTTTFIAKCYTSQKVSRAGG